MGLGVGLGARLGMSDTDRERLARVNAVLDKHGVEAKMRNTGLFDSPQAFEMELQRVEAVARDLEKLGG